MKSQQKIVTDKKGNNPFHGMSAVVVQSLMKHLFNNGKITDSDIKNFTSAKSHRDFKIGSASSIRMMIEYKNHSKKNWRYN